MKVRTRRILVLTAALGLIFAAPACDSGDDGGGGGGTVTDTGNGGGGGTDTIGGDTGGGGTTDTVVGDTGGGTTDTVVGDTGPGGGDDGTVTDTGIPEQDTSVMDTGTTDTGTPVEDVAMDTGPEDTGPPPACPKKDGTCTPQIPDTWGPAFRLSSLQVGKDGKPGEGLDVDPENGPEDCSPAGQCSDGIDNALNLLTQFNSQLQKAVDDGSFHLLGEVVGDDMSALTLNMYTAEPADEACDFTKDACDYNISDSSWGCDCNLLVAFESASVTDGKLVAGGVDAKFKFEFPVSDTATLAITAHRAKVEGTLEIDTPEAGQVTLTDAVLGGAIRKDELLTALEELPDDALPIPKTLVATLLGGLKPDIDTDGDGEDDALSVGLKLGGIPANITGVEAPAP